MVILTTILLQTAPSILTTLAQVSPFVALLGYITWTVWNRYTTQETTHKQEIVDKDQIILDLQDKRLNEMKENQEILSLTQMAMNKMAESNVHLPNVLKEEANSIKEKIKEHSDRLAEDIKRLNK